MARGPTDQGVWVIEVRDVDTQEVGESDGRSWGDANAPFGDFAEEMGRADRAQPAVARKAEAAMASSTRTGSSISYHPTQSALEKTWGSTFWGVNPFFLAAPSA